MNIKLKRILEKADTMSEKEAEKFLEKEIPLIFDELSMEEIGKFFDDFNKDLSKFEKKVLKFIEKEDKNK